MSGRRMPGRAVQVSRVGSRRRRPDCERAIGVSGPRGSPHETARTSPASPDGVSPAIPLLPREPSCRISSALLPALAFLLAGVHCAVERPSPPPQRPRSFLEAPTYSRLPPAVHRCPRGTYGVRYGLPGRHYEHLCVESLLGFRPRPEGPAVRFGPHGDPWMAGLWKDGHRHGRWLLFPTVHAGPVHLEFERGHVQGLPCPRGRAPVRNHGSEYFCWDPAGRRLDGPFWSFHPGTFRLVWLAHFDAGRRQGLAARWSPDGLLLRLEVRVGGEVRWRWPAPLPATPPPPSRSR